MQKPGATLGWIFVALIAGTLLGSFFPQWGQSLTPLGAWVLLLVKAAATPLVFFAVLEAIVRFSVQGRDFIKLLTITSMNAIFAVGVGLFIANIFQPGQYLHFLRGNDEPGFSSIDLLGALSKQLPSSIAQPFLENNIMAVVILALGLGFAWRHVKRIAPDQYALLEQGEAWLSLFRTMAETVLVWVVRLLPLAVFAACAHLVATKGFAPFKGLSHYVALCLFGMGMHLVVIYGAWLSFYVRIGLRKFWRAALQPALYAFGVNSSLVSLPLTLAALDKLGVSRRASALAACVGTNLNNDGIILYEGFTLLAIAQASGMELSISMQIFAALYCIVAAMGVAGVPEAGIVALSLVLSSLGLPLESLAILLSVDWILARGRSLLNTSSDMVGSLVLDSWIKRTESVLAAERVKD